MVSHHQCLGQPLWTGLSREPLFWNAPPPLQRASGGEQPGSSLRERKKSVPKRQSRKMTTHSSYVPPWLLAIGGWRLAVGDWRVVAVGGGWRRLVVGDWWLAAVGSGWRLAVGRRWRLAVGGWWRLAIGGWRSPGAVLSRKKIGFLQDRPGNEPPPPPPPRASQFSTTPGGGVAYLGLRQVYSSFQPLTKQLSMFTKAAHNMHQTLGQNPFDGVCPPQNFPHACQSLIGKPVHAPVHKCRTRRRGLPVTWVKCRLHICVSWAWACWIASTLSRAP